MYALSPRGKLGLVINLKTTSSEPSEPQNAMGQQLGHSSHRWIRGQNSTSNTPDVVAIFFCSESSCVSRWSSFWDHKTPHILSFPYGLFLISLYAIRQSQRWKNLHIDLVCDQKSRQSLWKYLRSIKRLRQNQYHAKCM